MVLVHSITEVLGEDLSDKKIAIWGLAFKPGTDDMREAPSIRLIDELKQRGAKVQAYDPQAMNMAKSFYLKDVEVEYINNKYDAIKNKHIPAASNIFENDNFFIFSPFLFF